MYSVTGSRPTTKHSNTEARTGQPLEPRDADDFVRLVMWAVADRDVFAEQERAARAYVLAERTIGGNIWRWRDACTAPTAAA
jgi:hypothetical protein